MIFSQNLRKLFQSIVNANKNVPDNHNSNCHQKISSKCIGNSSVYSVNIFSVINATRSTFRGLSVVLLQVAQKIVESWIQNIRESQK